MNYPAAELRGIKMNFYLINPDAEHRGILLIKSFGMEVIDYGKTELNNTEYNVRSLCYVYQKRIK